MKLLPKMLPIIISKKDPRAPTIWRVFKKVLFALIAHNIKGDWKGDGGGGVLGACDETNESPRCWDYVNSLRAENKGPIRP